MSDRELEFEVSAPPTLTFDWLIDSSNRSKCQHHQRSRLLANRLGTSETQIVHPPIVYSATGEYTAYTLTYTVDQRTQRQIYGLQGRLFSGLERFGGGGFRWVKPGFDFIPNGTPWFSRFLLVDRVDNSDDGVCSP
jgi:hypothetical protein